MKENKGQDQDPRAAWGPAPGCPDVRDNSPWDLSQGSAKIWPARTKGQFWAALYFHVPD